MELNSALDYEIQELILITNYGAYDIRTMYLELNIFDSILQPSISGNILIKDSTGLNNLLNFDGSEFIKMDIAKNNDELRIKKVFRVYKEGDRKPSNMSSETFVLNFVSDEYVYSEQQNVNRHFKTTYSGMIESILSQDLKINPEKYYIEQSNGVRDVIVPNLSPIESMIWCSKRALNDLNLPNFVFFENLYGFNFVSISTLKSTKPIVTIFFEPKNIENFVGREFFGARDLEVLSQFDYLDNVVSGVYSGTFVGFDYITRTILEQKISFDDIFRDKPMNKLINKPNDLNRENLNSTQMPGSRIVVYSAALGRSNSQYIIQNNKISLNIKETPEYFVFQRRAILRHLFSQRIKIALPGNFAISSGTTIQISKQKSSFYDNQNDNRDSSLFGKYLVVASRHVISDNKHETFLELVTDSKDIDEIEPRINVKELVK